MTRHTPVLLHEVITLLDPQPGDFIIDGTLDGGGHAAAILESVGPKGKVLGVDWDHEMIAQAKVRFAKEKKFFGAHGNYAELPQILRREKLGTADGLLLDLGFSSEQLERSGHLGFISGSVLAYGDEDGHTIVQYRLDCLFGYCLNY